MFWKMAERTRNIYTKKYPKKRKEKCTASEALVRSITLSEVASGLNIGDFMLLSKAEAKSLGKARQYILANAFEAIIGAVYLEHAIRKKLLAFWKNSFRQN